MGNLLSQWDTSHRQWPLPRLPWMMKQTWNNLLFAHYPIKYEVLEKLVPNALPLDSFDGITWVGIVSFEMSGVRLRGVPRIPGLSRFSQVNVRTYVSLDGKPGVYFLSIDAGNWLAATMARNFIHIPYMHAKGSLNDNGNFIRIESGRQKDRDVKLACTYRPISESFYAVKGSFDEWLTERYCFYTVNKKGDPLRCDILHKPWPLQKVEAEYSQNTLLSGQGIIVDSERPTILHFSKEMDVRAWPLLQI